MLTLSGIAVDAVSVGGLETCIQLPGLDVAFDMGVCPPRAVARTHVLFTHSHIDHMGAVAAHCATRSLMGMAPPTYAVPAERVDAFHELLSVWRRLDGSALPCTVIPASPGTEVPLGRGRVGRAARSLHRVPCLSWSIWSHKKKLAPAWLGASGREIAAARARGEDVEVRKETCEVAFTGDTLVEAIEREESLRTARLLIMEVTFLDDRVSVAAARDKGHIHLDEVVARADIFANEHILFTHMSARYRQQEAEEILARRLPPSLRERVTLLPPRRMRPVLR
ncbi:MAG: MBL fold metallo-hydrolase [Myxococcota bacterium]|nr:MBL fold metallo-hydrolase [Myxococcota bacterium]